MKASNKSSIITGAVLLVLAALFSICLITQPLNFGAAGPGHDNFFYLVGNMLSTVYGFSSILIPAFLLLAGLSCFATQWTAKKTMRLITALLPFFTCVVTEKIIRSIIELGGNFSAVKIIIALVTGAMLVVIEYLGAGILADKIQGNSKTTQGYSKLSKIDVPEVQEPVESKHVSIFDKVLAAVDNPKKESNADIDDAATDEKFVTDADEDEYSDYNSEQSSEDEENPYASYEEELAQEEAAAAVPESPAAAVPEALEGQAVPETTSAAPEDDEAPAQSSSMITQEEFAALTNPEPAADELEWPDLPPQPESLPPEYDADFDENDPALEFPPKEENEKVVQPAAPADDEIVYEDSPAFEENEETPEQAADPYSSFDIDTEFGEKDQPAESEDDPYAATKYIDSVVENPRFPHGIMIHDGSEEEDDEEEAPKQIQQKSKYPSKIRLGENDLYSQSSPEPDTDFDDNYVEDETLPMPDFDIETPAINHETESFEETSVKDFAPEFEEEEEDEKDNLQNFFDKVDTSATEKDIEDPYQAEEKPVRKPAKNLWTNAPVSSQPAVSSQPEDEQEAVHEDPRVFRQIAQSEAVSDVFSDMEEEIRRNLPPKQEEPVIQQEEPAQDEPIIDEDFEDGLEETQEAAAPAAEVEISPIEKDEDFDEKEIPESETHTEIDSKGHIVKQSNEPNLDRPASANNLTADELTDFFNAQQEKNKPKGTEIVAAPPKVNHVAAKKGPYVIPSDLLTAYKDDEYWVIDDATKKAAMNLKQTLAEFNIEAEIIGIKKGPVVTMFELLPAPGVKLSKIVALQDNIALSLAAQSVRIVAPIPGKQAVGIEVPNRHRSVVGFREIIEMNLPEWKKMSVPVVLGKDILGKAQLIDLVKTPHMLIAGATGSGKSVCVNSLILSILYKRSFRDVKLILVDPKVVELKLYNNIPHLLTPVITEPKKALQALKWALCEMERRYALLDHMSVRDISTYNQKIKEQEICTEKLPYIVIIIDEFADLMATSGKELESVIARLTAMSRAVGIHLVLATQRPSVNVITGLIKANIPTRIAFMVSSRTDSNIIIDTVGAEKLLGRGDMLYASAVDPAPVRIQGTFVSDQEVEDVVRAVKEYGEPDYIDEEIFMDDDDEDGAKDLFGEPMDDDDPLYDQALEIVVQAGKASASYIQRRLKIGYNRAARLVEEMEERGIVGPANGSKPREVIHIP